MYPYSFIHLNGTNQYRISIDIEAEYPKGVYRGLRALTGRYDKVGRVDGLEDTGLIIIFFNFFIKSVDEYLKL